jgi:hypothetical protein
VLCNILPLLLNKRWSYYTFYLMTAIIRVQARQSMVRILAGAREFPPKCSDQLLRPAQPLTQWVRGFCFSHGGYAANADVIHSPLGSEEVVYGHTSTPPWTGTTFYKSNLKFCILKSGFVQHQTVFICAVCVYFFSISLFVRTLLKRLCCLFWITELVSMSRLLQYECCT